MVCMDGFILTHAYEQVDVPEQEQVDAFLPPYVPRQVLDPAEPVSMGAMVGPRRSWRSSTSSMPSRCTRWR
jgi:pyruvate ferredoxin oxidoreductase alpha subunit